MAGIFRLPVFRLIRIGATAALVVAVALVTPPWLRATIPERRLQQVGHAVLFAAQPVYLATLIVMLAGLIVLGCWVARARRDSKSRHWAARLLLLSSSTLAAFAVSETVTTAVLAKKHAHRAIPSLPTVDDNLKTDDLNVVVIGGSAAYGLPFEKWLSTGHIVAWKLGEAIPDRRVHLEVLAEPGVHLEWMHL